MRKIKKFAIAENHKSFGADAREKNSCVGGFRSTNSYAVISARTCLNYKII